MEERQFYSPVCGPSGCYILRSENNVLLCTFSQSVTSTQVLRSSFSHCEWFQCVRICHGEHTNVSNSSGRIYMTLNIVFFVTSPGTLVMFLVTHTSVGSGPWVLPLIFLYMWRLLREMLGDRSWEVFGRRPKTELV